MSDLQGLIADLTSGDDARAEASIPALTVLGETAIESLLELLDAPIPDRRWWAVRALAAFPQASAGDGLCRALRDPDISVRQCAAVGLREQPTPKALTPLIDALRDPDRLLRRTAGDALAALGPEASAALAKASKDPDPSVRIEAVRALAQMRHPDAIEPLFRAIDDPSSVVVHWAEEGLDRLGIGMIFFKP